MLPDLSRSPMPDLVGLGVAPQVAWDQAKTPAAQSAAVTAAVRLDLDQNGPCPVGVIRPLAHLSGWYIYQGPVRENGPNRSQTLLALAAHVVEKRLGCLPSGPTKVVALPPSDHKDKD